MLFLDTQRIALSAAADKATHPATHSIHKFRTVIQKTRVHVHISCNLIRTYLSVVRKHSIQENKGVLYHLAKCRTKF